MSKTLLFLGAVALLAGCQQLPPPAAPAADPQANTAAINDLLIDQPVTDPIGHWSSKYNDCLYPGTNCGVAISGAYESKQAANQPTHNLAALAALTGATPEQVRQYLAADRLRELNPAFALARLPQGLLRASVQVSKRELNTGTFYFFTTAKQAEPLFVVKVK